MDSGQIIQTLDHTLRIILVYSKSGLFVVVLYVISISCDDVYELTRMGQKTQAVRW